VDIYLYKRYSLILIKRRLSSCLPRDNRDRAVDFCDLVNRRSTCGMVCWDSATARSGVLSSRYSSAVCCPRASHIPAAGRSAGAWSAGGIEAISPKAVWRKTIHRCIEGWDGGQTRCFPLVNSLSPTALSLCVGGVIDEESVARARQGRVERGESVNGASTVILRVSRAK
jgi:hypothetical protein